MRDASTASGWRRSIIWSTRELKKSSVAVQEDITAVISEISRYWISNWVFVSSAITPERQCL
jgi:hypothetical protein